MSVNFKIISVYILLCLIWGSTWLAIRIGLESLTPFFSAGLRFLVATSVIAVLIKIKKIAVQKDKLSMKLYFLLGFFSFFIPFGLVYWGEQFIPSGLASVLFAVYPFFVALFSFFILRSEVIGANKIIGMILSFSGILAIFSDTFGVDISNNFLGMLAIVISGIMQAAMVVIIKKYGHHLNPLSMNLYPMVIAGFFMFVFGLLTEDISTLKLNFYSISSILFLAVFGSVITFTGYYWLLKRMNVVILSFIAFITPIVALIVGWIFYDEVLQTHHFIGSLLVLGGLLISNLSSLKNLKQMQIFYK